MSDCAFSTCATIQSTAPRSSIRPASNWRRMFATFPFRISRTDSIFSLDMIRSLSSVGFNSEEQFTTECIRYHKFRTPSNKKLAISNDFLRCNRHDQLRLSLNATVVTSQGWSLVLYPAHKFTMHNKTNNPLSQVIINMLLGYCVGYTIGSLIKALVR